MTMGLRRLFRKQESAPAKLVPSAGTVAPRPVTVDQLIAQIRDEHIQRNELADAYQAEVNRSEGRMAIGGSDVVRRRRAQIESANRAGKATSALVALGAPAVEDIVAELLSFARSQQWHVHSVLGHDLDWQVRRKVGETVGEVLAAIGDNRAGSLLIVALADPDKDVRYTVANALKTLKDSRAIGALAQTLSDSSGDVRSEAEEALKAIGGSEADRSLARLSLQRRGASP
jgi:HEAT repeat protein